MFRPREYLSFSQLTLFEMSPEKYIDKYLYGKKERISRNMALGNQMAEGLEADEATGNPILDLVMARLPKFEVMDKAFRATLEDRSGNITILAKPDTMSITCPTCGSINRNMVRLLYEEQQRTIHKGARSAEAVERSGSEKYQGKESSQWLEERSNSLEQMETGTVGNREQVSSRKKAVEQWNKHCSTCHGEPYIRFSEFKTSTRKWTQAMVDDSGQITFYATAMWLVTGKIPQDIELVCAETAFLPDGSLGPTGQIWRIPTKRTMTDILKMTGRMRRAWRGIGELCQKEMF